MTGIPDIWVELKPYSEPRIGCEMTHVVSTQEQGVNTWLFKSKYVGLQVYCNLPYSLVDVLRDVIQSKSMDKSPSFTITLPTY